MAGRPRPPETPDGLLSPREFARRVGFSYGKVLRLIHDGRIDVLRENSRTIYIHPDQIERLRRDQAEMGKRQPLPAFKRGR